MSDDYLQRLVRAKIRENADDRSGDSSLLVASPEFVWAVSRYAGVRCYEMTVFRTEREAWIAKSVLECAGSPACTYEIEAIPIHELRDASIRASEV